MSIKTIMFSAAVICSGWSSAVMAQGVPVPEPIFVPLIHGAPQPVPPLIDFGRIRPGQPQTIVQTFDNGTGLPLPITSIAVIEGDFSLLNFANNGKIVPASSSFHVSVTASGDGTGLVEGTLAIVWGESLGHSLVALEAFVDLVDAEVPQLSVAQTGFELGATAPFGVPLGLPAPAVSAAAALAGGLGVAIPHTASSSPSFLHYFFPNPRGLCRAEFLFDPNSLEIPNSAPETIAGFYDYGLPIAWLELRRFRSSFEFRVLARLDNGATGASPWTFVLDGPVALTFDWWAGQPGAFDGGVRVRCGEGCATEFRSAGLNFLRTRNFRVGAVSGVSTSAVGHSYVDELRVAY